MFLYLCHMSPRVWTHTNPNPTPPTHPHTHTGDERAMEMLVAKASNPRAAAAISDLARWMLTDNSLKAKTTLATLLARRDEDAEAVARLAPPAAVTVFAAAGPNMSSGENTRAPLRRDVCDCSSTQKPERPFAVQMGSILNHATAQTNHKLAHQAAFHQHSIGAPLSNPLFETSSRVHTRTVRGVPNVMSGIR